MFEGWAVVGVWGWRRPERWVALGAGLLAGVFGVAALVFVFWLPLSGLVLGWAGLVWGWAARAAWGMELGAGGGESD